MGRRSLLTAAAVAGLATTAGAGSGARTRITVWAAPTTAAYGGLGYGGYAPTTGAMIIEQREVDVPATGEIRIAGVAATVDPGSVQLRDLSDASATVAQQRFLPGAVTPTEILGQHLGDPVTVVTTKGEVTGVLRSVDEAVLVLEVGSGDQRRLQIMRRDGYVQDVRLPAGTGVDKPTLAWQVETKKRGTHTIEASYRAEGIAWSADYLAVLDATGKAVDFSAWATVKNATGASFDHAELTLVSGGNAGPSLPNPYGTPRARTPAPPLRYVVPSPVHLGAGQSVQVELVPPRLAAKARTVVTYEAIPDQSENYQAYPNTDCSQFAGAPTATGQAEVAVELDIPATTALPAGRVRTFRRLPDRLEVVSEEQLRTSPGLARIRIAPASDITGERLATCTYDERGKTITEKVTVKLENTSKQAADVVLREFLWRWPIWRLEAEDTRGTRAGTQTQEYRVSLPAGGKRSVTYSVLYTTW
jgi:hypothetical protein